jgi:voltage-gated potassium channel
MTAEHGLSARGFRLIDRALARFQRDPVSVRKAASVIVIVTAFTVVASGLLMRVIDHKEFHSFGVGLWWAVQTVTTVGYGDVTPRDVGGRLVAAAVMLEGTALIAVVTAVITSTFVSRARIERDASGARHLDQEQAIVNARFDDLSARLERIEELLRRATPN